MREHFIRLSELHPLACALAIYKVAAVHKPAITVADSP